MMTVLTVIALIAVVIGFCKDNAAVVFASLAIALTLVIATPVKQWADTVKQETALMRQLGYERMTTEEINNITPNELKEYPYVAYKYWKRTN